MGKEMGDIEGERMFDINEIKGICKSIEDWVEYDGKYIGSIDEKVYVRMREPWKKLRDFFGKERSIEICVGQILGWEVSLPEINRYVFDSENHLMGRYVGGSFSILKIYDDVRMKIKGDFENRMREEEIERRRVKSDSYKRVRNRIRGGK